MGVNKIIAVSLSGADKLPQLLALTNNALYEKAVRGGLSTAAKTGAVQAAKNITGRYNIKSARVKQDIKGPWFSHQGKMATLALSTKPPSALQYGGKDKGKGLSMSVYKGTRVQIDRGFIAKTGNLQGKPFRRIDGNIKPLRRSRLGFVSGPSIGKIYAGKSRFGQQIRSATAEKINEAFAKGVARVIESAKRGF